ncbi:MAG: LacI family transcriptional regulator [Cytophagales bacterium]|nr:LacI family transcriptional regulator [Cytophagales bacterium]
MKKGRVTLTDIAKELNVSIAVVSYVLSGKAKENKISEEMTKKVLAAAERMNYRVNHMARGLRLGKSNTLGLVVADISNPFFGKMARCIENEASRLGYQVLFASSDESDQKLSKIVNTFLSRQVDGMIVVPVSKSEDIINRIKSQGVPTVLIDRYSTAIEEDSVCLNNYEGGREIIGHLITKGYRKIALVTDDCDLSNRKNRQLGYENALSEAGLQHDGQVFMIEPELESVTEQMEETLRRILKGKFDAVLFINNWLGVTGLRILSKWEVNIPEDLAVVSFDDSEAFQLSRPSITCLQQPLPDICLKAVTLLHDKINNPKKQTEKQRIFEKGKLIVRGSC